jgi:hypothetical protein
MKINLTFNLESGYEIKLIAETMGEQAILHLLYDMKDIKLHRDHSIHESYKRVEYLTIAGRAS